MKDHPEGSTDQALIANMRAAYTPAPVDADRFDAALQARLGQPRRRSGWAWGAWLGGTLAAAAAVAFMLWPGTAEQPGVDAPAPQMAAVTPSVESSAGASTLPAESTWLAAMEYEPESADELVGLPDDYSELADFLEL